MASLLSKHQRRKLLTVAQAKEGFRFAEMFAPKLVETRVHLPLAVELTLRHQISLWDGIYLAVAVAYECPLLTADAKLHNALAKPYPRCLQLVA